MFCGLGLIEKGFFLSRRINLYNQYDARRAAVEDMQ